MSEHNQEENLNKKGENKDVSVTEIIDPKTEEAELVKLINGWEQESEDFYNHLRRVWEENLEYYKGNQTDVGSIAGKRSKAVENRIWMGVETTIPIATSRLPDIEVVTEDTDEQSQMDAQDTQDILGFQMERLGMQEKAEYFVRHQLLKRFGVFKVGWNQEGDDVDIKVIDPKRLRFPKFGRSVNELAFILEELELSYPSLVSFFGEEKAKKVLANSYPKELESKVRKKNFVVTEAWTNDFVAWKVGSIILDKKENPYFDFKNSKQNFFSEARKPYIIKSLFQTEESLVGETDYVQQVKPIQDNINIRKRQIEDIVAKVANPPLLVDSDVMSEEEAANISNEPGLLLYGKDAANASKLRFESPGQVPAYLFNDLEFSRKEFDNIWGLHSTTRGEREGRETATGRQLLRQADLGRIDLVARQLERALDEVAEYLVQLIKLFYTEERAVPILGADGQRLVKNFSNKKVGKIRLTVRAGSTLPKDEVAIANMAKELWQLQGIGPKTLYKMLKLSNSQEAFDDFVSYKSGAYLQGGGINPATPQGAAAPVV